MDNQTNTKCPDPKYLYKTHKRDDRLYAKTLSITSPQRHNNNNPRRATTTMQPMRPIPTKCKHRTIQKSKRLSAIHSNQTENATRNPEKCIKIRQLLHQQPTGEKSQ
jgi:hypothetical protein